MHMGLTSCIKHLAVSGLSNSTARIKSSRNLTGNRFEMPNVSYTQPLAKIEMDVIVTKLYLLTFKKLNFMKTKRVLKFLVTASMAVLIFSCEKENYYDSAGKLDESEKPQSFKELGLEHNYSTPLEALDFEVEDLQSLYFENGGLKSASIEEEYPSISEMAAIVEENLSKYPNVYEMDSLDYLKVKSNFPSLTDEQIEENLDLIDDYYTKNLQYDLILGIIEEKNKPKLKSGTGDYLGTGLYSQEFWYLSTRPRAISSVKDAAEDAEKYTKELYGANKGGDQSDAFRHICWNTLIAKYHADKKNDIDKGVELAKEFTDRHEKGNKEAGSEDYDCEMDYHNNWIGRDYFKSIASIKKKSRKWFGKKKYLDCPSNDTIKKEIKKKVDNGKKVSKTVEAVKAVSKYTPVYFN